MDLDKNLIESGNRNTKKSWRGMTGSLVAHGALFGLVAVLSLNATEKVDAEDKPVPVYMEQAAAPPPPPPPPPPAGAPATPQKATPKIEAPKPVVEVPKFVAPIEVPKTVPTVEAPTATDAPEEVSEPLAPGTPIGAPGGVVGGTVGGEVGGQLGGVIGGVQGGVVGGTPGGVIGGTPGVTGTAPAPAPAPVVAPPAPAGPVRVGGDVRAPVVVTRVEPKYTELARRSRVTGTVIVEAIIDKHGNVDRVRIVKGLPMGLSEAATDAVRRWKFRPGTQQGRPVDVIFNLTVVFTLGSDGPSVTKASRMPVRPQPSRQKASPKPADPPAAVSEPAPAPEPTPEPTPVPDTASETPETTTP